MLAVQAKAPSVMTIEGLANGDELHPMQAAFRENHGLQCGFCTPGMVMSAVDLLKRNAEADRAARSASGSKAIICRCTGYHNIVKAIAACAENQAKA